jgi:hypothetical protein
MPNNSESVERILGSKPGSAVAPSDSKRTDAVNSGKTPVRDASTAKADRQAAESSGRPRTMPNDSDTEHSGGDADCGEPSRQTSEAQDEAGQV